MPLLPFANARGSSGGGITIGTTAITSGTSTRILYDNAGVVGEYTLTGTGTVVVMATGPTITGPAVITESVGSSGLTITGATQTASFPALNITQTWNNSGVAFSGLKLNITNTASASTSKTIDIQLAGVSKISADVNGILSVTTVNASTNVKALGSSLWGASQDQGADDSRVYTRTLALGSSFATDTTMTKAAAATFQFGVDVNGAAVSQQLQACNGITGTDKTGGNLTIASGKGTGAGAVSSLIFQTPTVLASGTTAQSLATRLTLSSAGAVFTGGITTLGGAVLHTTSSALTDGAGAGAGTITNAPSAGNPTKWIGINDNGTTRYIPAW